MLYIIMYKLGEAGGEGRCAGRRGVGWDGCGTLDCSETSRYQDPRTCFVSDVGRCYGDAENVVPWSAIFFVHRNIIDLLLSLVRRCTIMFRTCE